MYPQKLRLGLLLDSFSVPAWVQNTIQRIVNGKSGEFSLVVLNGCAGRPRESTRSTFVYSVFNRIDEKLFTKAPDPFASRNVADLLSNVSVIEVTPQYKKDGWHLDEADIETIREYHLDILIKFGFDNVRCEFLDASKYGIWFYYHGDDRIMRGGPPGFWEVVENWSETSSALFALGGAFFPSRVLFRSHFVTYPFSPARHRSYYFWALTTFLPRQIDLLNKLGWDEYWKQTAKFNTVPLREIKESETPSNRLALAAISKIMIRLIREFTHRILYADQWSLLFSLNKDIPENFDEFKKIMPSKRLFWADPHVVQFNGKYYIFIEEFLQATNKGHISVIELDDKGNWKAPVKVLEREYHLSYPFIFEWQDRFYMVPESRGNRSIDLYECTDFPSQWNFKRCLMEHVSAVDTTLIHYSNKWWLFTGMAENEAAAPNVELFLFYKDDLFEGEWQAHPQNPIISDVKCARPAGGLFIKGGKLFRPSQDCSRGYGYGIDLNEVEVLSESEYRERRILSIRPDWDKKIVATHTLANCGNLMVIDTMSYASKMGF